MSIQREQYTMGYGPASTSIMASRTAESHAGFFLPHVKRGMSVLDCGCGPGTITIGFADIVAPGNVVATATLGSATVPVRWDAVVGPDGSNIDGYYVQRFVGATPSMEKAGLLSLKS